MIRLNLAQIKNILQNKNFIKINGRVSKIVGLTIEAIGPNVSIGDLCYIYSNTQLRPLTAEVVGFKENKVLLMPFGNMSGVGPGCTVEAAGETLKIGVGPKLLGRVLDGLGNPIDGKGPIEYEEYYSVSNTPPNPLDRKRIEEPLSLGVKAIDSLLTIGKGQRVGIFAGSGVGKSTLLGMIARNTKADINVIGLIGERGREVREFIEKDLKEEGLARSVVIVATSDQPALIRLKGAQVATAVAEYFREQGSNVMLMMDSLTRFAMAQREVGLAIGEPPVSRGYTPSVFAVMPQLLERAGASDKGTITALYTVLVDGDDLSEPVTDTVRGILDGHIVLSRKLANKNHYPAIDVLASVSRVMSDIVSIEHKEMAFQVKKHMAVYKEAEDLINIGAYAQGSNSEIDTAIEKMSQIKELITQRTHENVTIDESLNLMKSIISL